MKVKVRASVVVEIDLPDEWNEDQVIYHAEEHDCPGSGQVGRLIEKEIKKCEPASVCWACNLSGENVVLEIAGKPVQRTRT